MPVLFYTLLVCRRGGALPAWLLAAAAIAAEPSSLASPMLPPLSGELSGEFTPLKIPDAPTLRWTLTLRAGANAAERVATVGIDGPGVTARGEASFDAFDQATWRITAAEIDVGHWFPTVAAQFGAVTGSMSATGTLLVGGEGTLRDGKLAGRVDLELRDGAVKDTAKEWSVAGIGLQGMLGDVPGTLASDGPFRLTFQEATAAGVTARNGEIDFSIDADQTVHVLRARCNALEGVLELAPFAFKPAKPEVSTFVHFNRIQLGEFATMFPTVLADARGRVSGRMGLSWTAKTGLTPGIGRLQIEPGAEASVRLSATPGFLTSRVPRRLSLLPAWLGPIARAFSPENPAYETLREIEMGEMSLEVTSLDVGIRPEGDEQGRTARVVLTARPARGDLVESVRFEINVAGPLADVVRLALEGRMEVRAR